MGAKSSSGWQSGSRIRLAVLGAVAALWCWGAPVGAQAPVHPASPAIVGYIHVENLGAQSDAAQQWLTKAGVPGLPAEAMRTAVAGLIGDLKMTLVPRDAAVTIAWVHPQGDAGPAKRVVLLPSLEKGNYLDDCMFRTKQTCTNEPGLAIVGPAESAGWMGALAAPLKELHQTTQAADLVCYFRGALLTENRDAVAQAVVNVRPLQPATMFGAVPLVPGATPVAAAPGGGPRPVTLESSTTAKEDAARILGVVLQDVESIHFALDATQAPLCVTMNLTARPGSALAKFFAVPSGAANPLIGFTPVDGYVRAAVALNGSATSELARDVLARAFPTSDAAAPRGRELADQVTAMLALGDQAALSVRPPAVDGAPSWLLVTTPADPTASQQPLEVLAERSDLFCGPRKPGAGGLSPTPAGAGSLQPVMPGATPSASSAVHRRVLVASASETVEKFPVGRMDDTSAAPAGPNAAPLLLFCQAGPRLVASSDRPHLVDSLNRVLRLVANWPALMAQNTFVEGGSLYLDLRPAAQAGQPWTDAATTAQATVRTAGNCLQAVASIPAEMLAAPAAPRTAP